MRLFRWGYRDILKQSSWKENLPGNVKKRQESCRFQICGLHTLFIILGIAIARVILVERYHRGARGHAKSLRPRAYHQVACRYCKRVRSTSAAAETQIVGSDLRLFERRLFSDLAWVILLFGVEGGDRSVLSAVHSCIRYTSLLSCLECCHPTWSRVQKPHCFSPKLLTRSVPGINMASHPSPAGNNYLHS